MIALGTEATQRSPEQLAVVARLLVAPTHRRQGIGNLLLDVATRAAHARRLWPILDVAAYFHAAMRLYEQAGWACAGRVTVRIQGTDPLDELVYVGPAPGET